MSNRFCHWSMNGLGAAIGAFYADIRSTQGMAIIFR